MQDWMLWQKESECQQLRQRLDESCQEVQQLRIDNALLQEKLHQQEQRMQHELKLIKFAASQQRKKCITAGANNNNTNEHENRIVTVTPHHNNQQQQQQLQTYNGAPISVVETTSTNSSLPNHQAFQQHPFPRDPMEGFSLAVQNNNNSNKKESPPPHHLLPPKSSSSGGNLNGPFMSNVMPSPTSSTATRMSAAHDCHDSVTTDSEEGKDAFDSHSLSWPAGGSVASGHGSLRGSTAKRFTNAYKHKAGPLTAVAASQSQKPGPSPPRPSDKSPRQRAWHLNNSNNNSNTASQTPFPLVRNTDFASNGNNAEDKGARGEDVNAENIDAIDDASTEQVQQQQEAEKEETGHEVDDKQSSPWKDVTLRPVGSAETGNAIATSPSGASDTNSSKANSPKSSSPSKPVDLDDDPDELDDDAADEDDSRSNKDTGVPTNIDVDGQAPPAVPLEENVTFGTIQTTSPSPVPGSGATSPSPYLFGGQQQQQQQRFSYSKNTPPLPPHRPQSQQTTSTPFLNTSSGSASNKVSFVDDSASVGHTVASSTYGEDRQKVKDKIILDPYGDKGAYTGIILRSTGMPHGSGEMIYQEDRRTYTGEWRHGRWHGYGKASFANGDSYQGEYRFDQRHGRGIYQVSEMK